LLFILLLYPRHADNIGQYIKTHGNPALTEQHRAAKQFFNEQGFGKDGQPFPTYKQLAEEYGVLQRDKNALYSEKRLARENMTAARKLERRLDAILHNADTLLNPARFVLSDREASNAYM